MLYVSRYIDTKHFAVIDTADEVETIVSRDELEHIVCDLGIQIEGVIVGEAGFVAAVPKKAIINTGAMLAKLAMFYGVRLDIRQDVLTSIKLADINTTDTCRIRLSNYCRRLRNYMFGRSSEMGSQPKRNIVLVLDDRLTVEPYALEGVDRALCSIDISEVTSKKILKVAYGVCCPNMVAADGAYYAQYNLIDSQNRKEYQCAEFALNELLFDSSATAAFAKLVKNEYVRVRILHRHLPGCRTFLRRNLKRVDKLNTYCETLIRDAYLMCPGNPIAWGMHRSFSETLQTYFGLRDSISSFEKLRIFISYCDLPADIVDEYKKFVTRVCEIVYHDFGGRLQ